MILNPILASKRNFIIINMIIKTQTDISHHMLLSCEGCDTTERCSGEQYSSVVLHIVILYHACLDHDGNMQQILHLDIITTNTKTTAQTCKEMGSII